MIAWLTKYDYWLLLRNLAPLLVWNSYGDCLTDYIRLLAFARNGVKLLRWLPDWLSTTIGFCCETLHQFWCETLTVIAWPTTYDNWLLLRNFQHQFWCETSTVIAWLTAYDYWLLLRNFAPVLVWNSYGDCLTDCVRLLAFAAKLSAPVLGWNFYGDCLTDYVRLLALAAKLLRWLSYDIPLWFFATEKMSEYDHNREISGWQALTSAK